MRFGGRWVCRGCSGWWRWLSAGCLWGWSRQRWGRFSGGCAGADEKVSIGGCVGGGAGDDSVGEDIGCDNCLDSDYAVKRAQAGKQKKGSRGNAPCRVKGQRPLWGLGQRPNCSWGYEYVQRAQQKVQAAKRPCQERKPSNTVQATWEATAEIVERAIGKPSGTMPTTSLIEKSTLAVQKSIYFSLLQGFRLCGGDSGALRSPP